MIKTCQVALILILLFSPITVSADKFPAFFDSIDHESFFPSGIAQWELKLNTKKDNFYFLLWGNSEDHEIILKYRKATPRTIEAVYRSIGETVDKEIKNLGGQIISLSDFFGIALINDTDRNHSVNMVYGTPEGAYFWKYKVPMTFATNYEKYIETVTSVARKHQYDVSLKYGNITMGRWGSAIHEYARFLAAKNDPKSKTVYKNLLQTSPANYDAHIEYISITENEGERIQSAKIVERDAEEEDILNASAEVLNKNNPSLSNYPILQKKDNGLKVILIPLQPCNPWLLEKIADVYEKITDIEVAIRRLPGKWSAPEPSRSAYRPYLEKIASNIWPEKHDFGDWSLQKLKRELREKAAEEGPQAIMYIEQIFKKMDETGFQWEADPIMEWLSNEIAPHFSKDPKTMVVGITELDIFSGSTNYVFSLFGGYDESLVSILSYSKMRAKLTGENQSRKRLVERAAKELVPASLKKLEIPRSTDPACPYSYSSGLQRLDEKTLNLSQPVIKYIEKVKSRNPER